MVSNSVYSGPILKTWTNIIEKNLPPDIAVDLFIWTHTSFASTPNVEQVGHTGAKADTIKVERRNPALPPSGWLQDRSGILPPAGIGLLNRENSA